MRLWRRVNIITQCSSMCSIYPYQSLLWRTSRRYFSAASIDDDTNTNDETESDSGTLLPDTSESNPDCSTGSTERVTMMRFDTLGPAVVTETGKVRFFEDWEGKTEQEKEDILKIVIPRNKQRLQQLQDQEMESVANVKIDQQKQMESDLNTSGGAIDHESDRNIDGNKDDS